MKLFSSPLSPYSRKVRVTLLELGGEDSVEIVRQSPRDGSTGFHELNPLARVPALQRPDGQVLYDSPVVCEYLNSVLTGSLLGSSDAERWNILRRQALGDGLLDVGLAARRELQRNEGERDSDLVERSLATITRVQDVLESEVENGVDSGTLDLGDIAIACALGWLDFRMPELDWRRTRPRLTDWYAQLDARPSFASTRPA